jgi:hypothetical protein
MLENFNITCVRQKFAEAKRAQRKKTSVPARARLDAAGSAREGIGRGTRFIRRRAADRDAHAGNDSLGETDLILYFMTEAALFRRKRRIVGEHSGIAKDSGEGIVDFVGGLALALH